MGQGTPPTPSWRRRKAAAAVAASVALLAGIATTGLVLVGAPAGAASHGSSRASASASAGTNATISVTGTGTVNGAPDTLNISLSVSTSASNATSALSQNNFDMSRVQATLQGAGVPAKDLQTSNLSLNPNYDSSGNITGYAAQDDLQVTFTRLSSAGSVIDAASRAAGNSIQIQGLSFSISNTSNLMATARAQAMHDAHARAEDLARAAGASLGPVLKITDQEGNQSPTPIDFKGLNASAGAASASRVPLSAGTQQLSVQVSVVYELRN